MSLNEVGSASQQEGGSELGEWSSSGFSDFASPLRGLRQKNLSSIWTHFDVINGRTKCKVCGREYSKKTSTSTLSIHISSFHDSSSLSQAPDLIPTPHLPLSSEVVSRIDVKLAELVLRRFESFRSVSNPAFVAFVQELNEKYALPKDWRTLRKMCLKREEMQKEAIKSFFQQFSPRSALIFGSLARQNWLSLPWSQCLSHR